MGIKLQVVAVEEDKEVVDLSIPNCSLELCFFNESPRGVNRGRESSKVSILKEKTPLLVVL